MKTIEQVVYLDNASTTPMDKRVFDAMTPYFLENYGNASSNHFFGAIAKEAIEKARKQVAEIINASEHEIIFTSGATESINLALKGFAESNNDKGNHIITVKTEHKAVLATCEYLETRGYDITYLDVDENGVILTDQLRNSVRMETLLIVIMYVNNETGVIQPIKEIGEIARDANIAFFCDATQAVGNVIVDVERDNIDMLCFSGHKIKGPKGVGVLYKRRNIELTPLIHGGGQEKGLRSGTYNTPLIVGLGTACKIAQNEFEKNQAELLSNRKNWEDYFQRSGEGLVNFESVNRAPHILSISLNNMEAEEYLMMRSKEFIASTGSACRAEVIETSHVLKVLNINAPEKIIRISF